MNKSICNLAPIAPLTQSSSTFLDHTDSLCVTHIFAPWKQNSPRISVNSAPENWFILFTDFLHTNSLIYKPLSIVKILRSTIILKKNLCIHIFYSNCFPCSYYIFVPPASIHRKLLPKTFMNSCFKYRQLKKKKKDVCVNQRTSLWKLHWNTLWTPSETVKILKENLKKLMNQLSEAPSISNKNYNDPKSEMFYMNFETLASFHISKFQLVKLFTFFHTCWKFFSAFFGLESTVNKKNTVKSKVVTNKLEGIIHFHWMECLNSSFCNTDID